MFARSFIDNVDFARQGRELRGEIPVAELSRLQESLAGSQGGIRYVLNGVLSKEGSPVLILKLEGELQLRCQRCLQALSYPLAQESRLLLVPEAQLNDMALEDDDADLIPIDTHLDVVALIEDEILLALPLAPRHEEGVCHAKAEGLQQADDHPFAILRKLKS